MIDPWKRIRELEEEVARLRVANANNLEGWRQNVAGLQRKLAAAEKDRDEWKGYAESTNKTADGFMDLLTDVQVALDMRCVDDPEQVGCTDLYGTEAEEVRKVLARLAAAEGLLREVRENVNLTVPPSIGKPEAGTNWNAYKAGDWCVRTDAHLAGEEPAPVCGTCGGSRQVVDSHFDEEFSYPCPDCKPEGGE